MTTCLSPTLILRHESRFILNNLGKSFRIVCTITLNHSVFTYRIQTGLLVSIPRGLFGSVDRLHHTSRELGHMVVNVDSRCVCVKKRFFKDCLKKPGFRAEV